MQPSPQSSFKTFSSPLKEALYLLSSLFPCLHPQYFFFKIFDVLTSLGHLVSWGEAAPHRASQFLQTINCWWGTFHVQANPSQSISPAPPLSDSQSPSRDFPCPKLPQTTRDSPCPLKPAGIIQTSNSNLLAYPAVLFPQKPPERLWPVLSPCSFLPPDNVGASLILRLLFQGEL